MLINYHQRETTDIATLFAEPNSITFVCIRTRYFDN